LPSRSRHSERVSRHADGGFRLVSRVDRLGMGVDLYSWRTATVLAST
jgi:hypothetical protein